MPYTPTPGVFENGLIIDGPDIQNEFGLIASELNTMDSALRAKIAAALAESKAYTDTKSQGISIDGGTV